MSIYKTVLDVSAWQGPINWKVLKSRNPALVYIKLTDGAKGLDLRARENIKGAIEADQPFSLYHYIQPAQDPLAQAKNFCDNLPPTEEAPVADIEEVKGIPANYSTRTFAFLREVEKRSGRRPTIYTRSSYWKLYLAGAFSWARYYLLMVAHYTELGAPAVCLPWDPHNWYIHQYGTPALGSYYGVSSKDIDASVANIGGLAWDALPDLPLPDLTLLADQPSPKVTYSISVRELLTELLSTRPNYRRGTGAT